jgi:uncharacterized protein
MYALLKKAFFGPFQKPWRWPDGIPQTDWERVEFTNASGCAMVGLLARARSGPAKATVVVPHPMTADAKAFALKSGHADFLRDAGYDVFVFDFNGFGESVSGKFEFPRDIVAAGHAAAARTPGQPVVLFGISMGAGYGVCALDVAGHPFRAAVLESAFSTLEEFWKRYRFPYLVLRALTVLMPKLAHELRPIDRIRTITGVRDILFIHGDKDVHTPPAMGVRLLDRCPLPDDRKALWIVPGGKHLRTLTAAGDDYRARIVAFFDVALTGIAAPRVDA